MPDIGKCPSFAESRATLRSTIQLQVQQRLQRSSRQEDASLKYKSRHKAGSWKLLNLGCIWSIKNKRSGIEQTSISGNLPNLPMDIAPLAVRNEPTDLHHQMNIQYNYCDFPIVEKCVLVQCCSG